MEKLKTFLNWSSGKDCSMALQLLLDRSEVQVDQLFTTVSSANQRIGMHGLHESLLKQQANAIGLPLKIMYLPEKNEMETYNALMQEQMQVFLKNGFTHAAFGDIFLEDLKTYREAQLNKVGLKGLFPLWKKDTKSLLKEFVDKGFKAIVVAASGTFFEANFVGTEINDSFIDQLPSGVDPCGENGEFHTFCYDGPIFEHAVRFKKGKKVIRSYPNPEGEGELAFHFLDLKPIEST